MQKNCNKIPLINDWPDSIKAIASKDTLPAHLQAVGDDRKHHQDRERKDGNGGNTDLRKILNFDPANSYYVKIYADLVRLSP